LADDNFTALYDGNSNVSSIYNAMAGFLSSGEEVFDYFGFNQDTRSFRTSPYPDFTQYDYYADEFRIAADNRQDIPGGAGSAQLFYEKANGDVWVSRIAFGNISYTTEELPASVPEPTAFWLLCLGTIGLLKSRFTNDSLAT